ncbi:hypothetical protein LRS06_18000 [Hymenobacter sp. J193]|nr:hypothetical protein [Hymenobacter sp. J193]MCR5889631.1 hypothetical protein [Hymenobacter sp. J193]
MQAGLQPLDGLERVQVVGRGYGEHVGAGARAKVLIQGSEEGHAGKLGGQGGLQLGADINEGDEPGTGLAGHQGGVAAADVAHAADSESNVR